MSINEYVFNDPRIFHDVRITFDAHLGVFDNENSNMKITNYLGNFKTIVDVRAIYESRRSQEEPHMLIVFQGGTMRGDDIFVVGDNSGAYLVRYVTA